MENWDAGRIFLGNVSASGIYNNNWCSGHITAFDLYSDADFSMDIRLFGVEID